MRVKPDGATAECQRCFVEHPVACVWQDERGCLLGLQKRKQAEQDALARRRAEKE